MIWPKLLGIALVLHAIGCAPSLHTRAGGGVGPLTVHEVDWNPTHAPLGQVRAVAETSGVTVVFANTGATVLSAGAVVAVDPTRSDWLDAAVIPGADGTAQWIVGLSASGKLYRLKDRSWFEDVSARYGFQDERVRSVAALGGNWVGFLLTSQLALADGRQIARYDLPGIFGLFGGSGYGVGVSSVGADVFHLADLQNRLYALPGVRQAALSADGCLYATTARAIYAALPGGDLSLMYDSQTNALRQLVSARNTVWFSEGTELGVVAFDRVLETNTRPVFADTRLAPAANGDVWAISHGALQRFTRSDTAPEGAAAAWANTVAPIFARVCSTCHEPGGVSGVDLSSAEAWQSERTEIYERVVTTRSMPPQGHELSAADRAVIEAWSRPQ
jgi:mono/diheme cytochrome c family protein